MIAISPPMPAARSRRGAFTLVEILVSLAVLSVLLLVSASVIGQVQDTWTASNARVSQFREARTAFDILTRNLSQATLNTYIDYETNYLRTAATAADAEGPSRYKRNSDLHFVCGPAEALIPDVGGTDYVPGSAVFFQAPLGVSQQPSLVGLDRLLCGRGYFVQFSSDDFFRPDADFMSQGNLRYRYRLMEFCPPAEKNMVYSEGTDDYGWFAQAGTPMDAEEDALNRSLNRPVADNIISLVISPRLENDTQSINGKALFDSSKDAGTAGSQGTQHLLPPMLKVVLIAIDERSAERLSNFDQNSEPPTDLKDALKQYHSSLGEAISDSNLETALETLRTEFVKKRINYRVFSTTVQIRGAKWSF